jgi:hypothetical protein
MPHCGELPGCRSIASHRYETLAASHFALGKVIFEDSVT